MSYDNISINNRPNIKKSADLPENRQYIPKPYIDGAKSMEKQFAQLMVKEMQKTAGKTSNNTADNYYRSLLSSQYAEQLGQNRGGLGVQKLLLDQLYPRRLRSKIAFDTYQRMQQQQPYSKNQQVTIEKTKTSPEVNQSGESQ